MAASVKPPLELRLELGTPARLAPGDPIARITDLTRLWLDVHIPEADVPQVTASAGVAFTVAGTDEPVEVGAGARVALGTVDATTRTASLWVAISNPARTLRPGMSARAQVFTGPRREALALPTTALVEEEGRFVAYVQVGGETFARRALELGARDGLWVEVRSGVQAGDRVVTEGAYALRLASTSTNVPAHGHVH